MNLPMRYTPAYIGLFASLWLALTCNVYLDIQYGSFEFEVFFWGALQGWTVWIGWRQHGAVTAAGQKKQKTVLVIALLLAVLIALPRWGIPRGGVYAVALLQAAQNCVTTTRRQLHMGLLVSAVLVMFAASHYRADWTMLFYLVPYIVAVVFTLVSEQISRQAQTARDQSLKDTGRAGQGVAIAAAVTMILSLAGLLYFLTPQVSWPYLSSTFGQTSILIRSGETTSGQHAGRALSGQASSGQDNAAAGQGSTIAPWREWPTPRQMRQAAGEEGMPEWQSNAILVLADMSETLAGVLTPIAATCNEWFQGIRQWLGANQAAIRSFLFMLLQLMLLLGLLAWLREVKAGLWLHTRFDYLYLVACKRHSTGKRGAIQFYRAMERIFALCDIPRSNTANTREFLHAITSSHRSIQAPATELTSLFEHSRYGSSGPGIDQLEKMRESYAALFRQIRE